MIRTIGLSKFKFRATPISYYRLYPLRAVSLYAARNRTQQVTTSVVQQFPPIPDNQADIGRLGLNRRPTFFGCDPKENPAEFPLLIYIPNAPPVDGSDPVTK
jgi:lysophospholipase